MTGSLFFFFQTNVAFTALSALFRSFYLVDRGGAHYGDLDRYPCFLHHRVRTVIVDGIGPLSQRSFSCSKIRFVLEG